MKQLTVLSALLLDNHETEKMELHCHTFGSSTKEKQ
jgi:hypothetical protein